MVVTLPALMVWPTLRLRTAKEQSDTNILVEALEAHLAGFVCILLARSYSETKQNA